MALLKRTIDDDRYPPPRIRTLRGILAKLEPPEPVRAPPPPLPHYAPLRASLAFWLALIALFAAIASFFGLQLQGPPMPPVSSG